MTRVRVKPLAQTKEAGWKRAQRKVKGRRKNRNLVRHHVDGVGNSERTVLLTRAQHARIDNPMKG